PGTLAGMWRAYLFAVVIFGVVLLLNADTLTQAWAGPAVLREPARTVPARPRAPVAPAPPAAPRYRWPLAGSPVVTRAFLAPPQPWLPGHRGVDLAGTPGEQVLAAGPGVVAFAGV